MGVDPSKSTRVVRCVHQRPVINNDDVYRRMAVSRWVSLSRKSAFGLAMTFSHLQNLSSNAQSHDEYLCQDPLKSLH